MKDRIAHAGKSLTRIGVLVALVATPAIMPERAIAEKNAGLTVGGSVTGQYLAGRFAHHNRDFAAAQRFFRGVTEAFPNDAAILRQSVVVSMLDGNMDAAITSATRLLELAPDEPIANLLMACADLKRGHLDRLRNRVDRMGTHGHIKAILPLFRAWAMAGQGETGAALKVLEEAAAIQGMAQLVDLHEGMILEFSGDLAAAEVAYLKGAKDGGGLSFPGAIMLADLYRRQNRDEDARKVYQRYMSEHPRSQLIKPFLEEGVFSGEAPAPLTLTDGMAEAMFSVASSMSRQRDEEASLMFGRLALYLHGDFPVAQLLVAEILEGMGRFESANGIYQTVDDSSPFAWSARVRAASNLDRIDKTEEAIKELKELARRHKDRYDVLVELADILRVHSRFEEASEAYDQAMGLMKDPAKDYGWTIFYYRGIALERSKQWDRAEKDFLRALELEPDQPLVLNYLGYSWVEQGKNLDRARQMIEQAVAQRPRDGYIVDSLGWVLYRLGDIEGAVKHLERAVELRPGDPIINDHLGDVYWKVGRKLEAQFQWQRALTLKPTEQDLIDAIKEKLRSGLDPDKNG